MSFNEKLCDLIADLNPSPEDVQKLAIVFQMDRTYKVYEALSIKPMSVRQLKKQLGIPESGTYRAVHRLREAGLVEEASWTIVKMRKKGGPYDAYWKLKDYKYGNFKWQLPT